METGGGGGGCVSSEDVEDDEVQTVIQPAVLLMADGSVYPIAVVFPCSLGKNHFVTYH